MLAMLFLTFVDNYSILYDVITSYRTGDEKVVATHLFQCLAEPFARWLVRNLKLIVYYFLFQGWPSAAGLIKPTKWSFGSG